MDLCQTHCVQVPDFSRHWGHVVNLDSFQFLPTGLHGLCFGCCFSGPLTLRSLTNGPPIGVRFGESLVVRLYSEIDQPHLSIEAQCVTTLLPLGDCHSYDIVQNQIIVSFFQVKSHLSALNVGKILLHPETWENTEKHMLRRVRGKHMSVTSVIR